MFKRAKAVLSSLKQPILVSHNHKNPTDISAALMTCAECKTQVLANFSLHAACPVCAETMVPAKSVIKRRNGKIVTTASGEPVVKTLDLTRSDLKEMPIAVTCQECLTDYRTTREIRASLDGLKLGCMVCASTMIVHAEDDVEEDDQDVDDEDTSDSDEDEASLNPEDAEPEDPEEDAASDTDEDDNSNDPDHTNEPEDNDDQDEDEDDGSQVADDETDEEYATGLRTQSEAEQETGDSGGGGDTGLEEEDEDEAEDSHLPVRATLSVDSFDKARKNRKAELSFVQSGGSEPVWYLFANGVPVAYSNKDMVKAELHNTFLTPTFGKIFAAASKDGLTDQVVADFGLTAVAISQPVEAIQADKVQQAVTAAVSKNLSDNTEMKAKFDQSVGIAAVGINKGVFASVKNPLREGLIATLASINVRNSEHLVDTAIATYMPEYIRTVIAKAQEIEGKPDEVIAEFAKLVSEASYRSSGTSVSNSVIRDLAGGSMPLMATAAAAAEPDTNVINYHAKFPLGRKARI